MPGTARKVIQIDPDSGYGATEDRTPAIAELWRQRHVAAAEAGRWPEINFPGQHSGGRIIAILAAAFLAIYGRRGRLSEKQRASY